MAETKIGSSVLVGLIAFIGVTAWMAIDIASSNPYHPGHVIEPRFISDHVATGSTIIPVHASLLPDEVIVTEAPPAPVPPVERSIAQPTPVKAASAPAPAVKPAVTTPRTRIIVEERRLSRDDRIRLAVMDRLAANPRLDGKIGVESRDAVVRLTGWTRTAGQARNAEREARSVRDVKYVQNEIRARIGGSV